MNAGDEIMRLLVERRERAQRTAPPRCFMCKEDRQIQLANYFTPVLEWRCRICKHVWTTQSEI